MNAKKKNQGKHDIDALIAELQQKKALREKASPKEEAKTKPKAKPAKNKPKINTLASAAVSISEKNDLYATTANSRGSVLYLLFLITLAASLYLFFIAQNSKQPDMQIKIDTLNSIKAKEESKLHTLEKSYLEYKTLITRLTKKRPFIAGILKEMSLIIPASAQVKAFELEEKSFILNGIIEKEGDRQEEIKRLIMNMTTSPFFEKIKVENVTHDRNKAITTFTIKGDITV